MRKNNFWNQKIPGNFFPLPNALFQLELTPGEIAVYAYLMYREDRKSYQCYPSYKTIGKAVHMSANTVRKYVQGLEEKRLIYTEPTSVMTKKGQKRNGSLLYTIRPIRDAVEYLHEKERQRADQKLAKMKLDMQRAS